jgi:Fur family transcriptional regulator, ferric uptake regulator
LRPTEVAHARGRDVTAEDPGPEDAIGDVLRANGFRVTPPRRLVWDVLVEADGHVTAEEIADRLSDRGSDVNLASIYRSLALLADLDLVRETRLGEGGAARWELAHPDEHFHLVCDACGSVSHHEGSLVEMVASHLREGHGFVPSQVELVVQGRCAACADG